MGIWDQFRGHYVMCSTDTSSHWVFKNKANGIPASLPFPFEKMGHGEKQGEGMWILFGWETKRQTKEAEADSLWRRLFYCKIGVASASLSKKKEKWFREPFAQAHKPYMFCLTTYTSIDICSITVVINWNFPGWKWKKNFFFHGKYHTERGGGPG